MQESALIADKDGWRTVSEETKYQDKYVHVTLQEVLTPSRPDKPARWTVVHRKAAVAVVPVTVHGKFVLVRQERIPVRASLWEFPAGQIDEEDSTDDAIVRATALRELREETGYELPTGAELVALGYFFNSQGFTDEHCHLFLARDVVPCEAGASHDENEGIVDCREFSADEFRRMVADGEINNANTLCAFARLCARGLFPG